MLRSLAVVLTVAFVACPGIARAAGPLPQIAVTTCGQIVPHKTLGYLTADLDCSGYTGGDPAVVYDLGAAVTLAYKAKLDLRGFTITAGTHGVLCSNLKAEGHRNGVCEIFNGTVTGAAQRGVAGSKLYIHEITATNNGVGLYSYGPGSGRIENCTSSDNSDDGVRVERIKMKNLTVTNNGANGIVGDIVKLRDSTVTGNGGGQFCVMNPGSCFDIHSAFRPLLKNVTCGTSGGYHAPPSDTWGVCSLD